jgi:hypothetical protein
MANLNDLAELNKIELTIDELEPIEIVIDSPKNNNDSKPDSDSKPSTEVKPSTEAKQTQIVPSIPNTPKPFENKNGWNPNNQAHFQICLHRLKYYHCIIIFFFCIVTNHFR